MYLLNIQIFSYLPCSFSVIRLIIATNVYSIALKFCGSCIIFYIDQDNDYHSGPYYVTLTPGATRFPFNVSVFDDDTIEKDETFQLVTDPS